MGVLGGRWGIKLFEGPGGVHELYYRQRKQENDDRK